MIKLLDILKEVDGGKTLITRRTPEERVEKLIQNYIRNGGKGDLDLSDSNVTSLPKNLKVEGNLYLNTNPLKDLPSGLVVGGSLYMDDTKITDIPSNIKVRKSIIARNSEVISLPDNFTVNEMLNLARNPLTSLPDNLTAWDVDVRGSKLDSIPKNITTNALYIRNTPLADRYCNVDENGFRTYNRQKDLQLELDIKEAGGKVETIYA